MKRSAFVRHTFIMITVLTAFWSAAAHAQDQPSAIDIVSRSAETDKIPGWSAKVLMRLQPKGGSERLRESIISSKLQPNGRDMRRLVQFISPADINGSNILIHEHHDGNDDIWIYLPSVRKVRRLLANSKKESFMGTDFTYTDITTPKVDEYTHKLLRREAVNGISCFVVESVPKTEETRRNTGYAKTVNWIRADNYVRVKSEIYDLTGTPFKAMRVYSVRAVDGRSGKWLLEKVEMRNLQSGHSTLLTFQNIETGTEISDKLFTPSRLDKDR